ncbi:unnamed protein product [Rangifer tarandus platyrhynchus]|uniref:VWFA domain-containing protein n=1 Tax=Rangifer tarandus platyrhynchus TaxID=3082113 RepID=A0ABN8ZYW7_RANTA|nr:unnamed protein product [Rangifer tarandus platyrhynchus]
MGNVGPGMLGSMLFLMLGLQPLPLSRGRFLHHPPSSRSFHLGTRHHGSTWEKLKSCKGAFDLYFIVDASQKANNIWKDINKLVDEIVKKYTNPNLQMSFITYSTQGKTVMKLTSDRQEISRGLSRLQNIVPTGATNLQEGLIKANKQIQHATSGENSASSLIITLTAGPLLPRTLQDTKKEAQQARDMGAKVYCLGVKDYKRDQLHNIVERKDQMYGIDEFNSAEKLVASLVKNSCKEMMAANTHFVCLGEAYKVKFSASGLQQKRKDEIVCRYQLGPRKIYGKRPISINKEKLICPGHMFDKAGQEVFIDYSLNNGVNFVDEDLKIAGKDCEKNRVGLQEPQWKGGKVEEHKTWEEKVKPSEPTVVSTVITLPTVIMIRTIVPTVVLTTTVPTVATMTSTVPTTITRMTTASTFVPEEETTVPEVVPEDETAFPEVAPEDETAFPEVAPEEETTFPQVVPEEETFPQVVPEDETTFPQVVPEEETFPQVVPEDETTFPQVVPEDETTFPQVVPEDETTFPQVVPEEETFPQVVPEDETTFPQVVPEDETTFPQVVPEEENTFPQVVPEDETTFPEGFPEEETTFPRRFPGNETTFPQVFRENEATFPEVSPEDETTFPEVIPEEEATYPEVFPEEEIIFPEAFPKTETTVPTAVAEETTEPTVPTVVPEEETTLSNIAPEEETTEPTVVPEEETTLSNISPEEETMVPTTVTEETTAPAVVPEEETTMPNISPKEETMVPTIVTEETTEPTVVPEEETTLSNISPEEETMVPTTITEETTAPAVVPEEETTMSNISPEEETTVPTTVTEETTAPMVVPEEETTIPEFFPEGEIIIRGTVPGKISLMPKVVSRNLLYSNPLWVPVLISALFLSLFLSLLVCICCHKWIIKKPSPAQKPEKKPCPEQGYTTVIIPCCECQEDRMRQMEGKLDVFYNFLQRCSLVPLMQCTTRDMGSCINFTLVNPHCAQMLCGSNICLQPSQECFPLNINSSDHQYPPPICPQPPSRMLPLIPPTARKLCRSSMSLPPP